MLPFRLGVATQPARKVPGLISGVCRLRQSPILVFVESTPEVRVLSSPGVTRFHWSYDPVRLPRRPAPTSAVEAATLAPTRASPNYPAHLSSVPCPIPRWTRTGASVGCFPGPPGPSPFLRRVGVHDFTFGACSGFTRVTARWIAQPPKAAFVTRLRPSQLPN